MLFLKRLDFSSDGSLQLFLGNDELIIGHANRFGNALECQFHIKMIFLRTENDANRLVFSFLTFNAVEQRKIVVHFTCIFRNELPDFQINGNKAAQSSMEEEHIHATFLTVVLQCMLIAYKSEAFAQFEQKQFYFFHKPLFQLQFMYWLRYPKEAEIIPTSEHLVGIGSLCGRQRGSEIIIGSACWRVSCIFNFMAFSSRSRLQPFLMLSWA